MTTTLKATRKSPMITPMTAPEAEAVVSRLARLSVEWVIDESQMASEVHKSKQSLSPDGLSKYLVKLSQAVDVGRSISFSRGWPKLPETGTKFQGEISAALGRGRRDSAALDRRSAWLGG